MNTCPHVPKLKALMNFQSRLPILAPNTRCKVYAKPSPSVFACCKQSKPGGWEGLGTRLEYFNPILMRVIGICKFVCIDVYLIMLNMHACI